MFCTKCGTELPDDSQFCRKCGHALTGATSLTPKEVALAPHRSPVLRWSVVALGVLVVVLLVGLGLVVWQVTNHEASRAPIAQGSSSPEAVPVAKAEPPSPQPLSPQELYQSKRAGMVLIETFDDEGRKRGLGSGFIVSSSGTAITNYHVIRGAYRATVKFDDGTVGSVDGVASYDQNRDLAVVQLAPSHGTALEIGNSDNVRVGDRVVAIGSPLGLQNTMSVGIVSGLRNGVIQMSDPISPGSSGGAVFDQSGKVIGVAVAQMVGGQNLNFAIPINWAKPYLNNQNPKPLSDVATENTVTENLLDGSVSVPQGQARTWNITVNPNSMSNAEVHGQIFSIGGLDGKITLALVYQGQPIFSCRERVCQIHQSIMNPGIYTLVLDNRVSPIFARTVTGQVSLKYVR